MKLSGSVKYQKTYLYTIYLSPKDHEEELIRIFGNRWNKGKRCFNAGEENYKSEISNIIPGTIYIVVHEKNTQDYGSASVDVRDLCFKDDAQAWLWGLCRHGIKTSDISPIKVLFDVIGQYILQTFKKKYIYLSPEPGEGIEKLKSIYTKYGFVEAYCPIYNQYAMRKKISLNKKLVSFSKTRSRRPRGRTRSKQM